MKNNHPKYKNIKSLIKRLKLFGSLVVQWTEYPRSVEMELGGGDAGSTPAWTS